MALLAEMVVKIGADVSKLEAGLTRAKAQVRDFGSKTENIRAGMDKVGKAGMVMGAGLGVGLGLAVRAGVDFDKRMSKVQALSGATGKEFKALRDQAIKLGADTAFSASEAADGMANLAASGMTTKQTIAAMPGVLDAAAASGEGLAVVSDIMVTALSGFGLEASQSSHVADVLAQAANKSTASIADMGETFKYVAPVAKATGISLDQTAAMATIMANAGIKGSQAGTTLRSALTRLATVPPMRVAEKLGDISPKLKEIWKSAVPVPQKLNAMSREFKNLSGDQRAAAAAYVFGTESMAGMLSVMDAGPGGVAKMTAAMQQSDGEAKRMAETMLDNLAGAAEQLGGSLESLGIGLASGLTPFIRQAADMTTALVNKFNALSPAVQRTIAVAVAITAAVTFFGGAALVATAAIIPLIGAAGGLMAVLSPLLIVVGIVAAIIALGVAFYMLYQRSETVRAGVKKAWDAIKAGVGEVLQSLKQTISVWVGWAKSFWAQYGANITAVAKRVWSGISQFIGGYLTALKGVITTVLAVLRGDWKGAWDGIKTILSGVWQAIQGLVKVQLAMHRAGLSAAWAGIKAAAVARWNAIKTGILAVVASLPAGIRSKLSGLVGILKSVGSQAGSALADAIRGAINAVLDRIREFQLPTIEVAGKKVPGSGARPFSGIGSFAGGGIVRGPGSGTSDSILARVSNGEAIIPAKATSRYSDLVHALIDGKLPGFAKGRRPPKRVAVNVGSAAGDLGAARFAADQSDGALAIKKEQATAALNAAVEAQRNALAALPRARFDAKAARDKYDRLKRQYDATVGKGSEAKRRKMKPALDAAKRVMDERQNYVEKLTKDAAKAKDSRGRLADEIASLEAQLAPEVVEPPTALESLQSLLASGESVAGLALAQAEGSADPNDDEPAKRAMGAFFADKAAKLAEFLAGPGAVLSLDEQTGIRNDIASSLRSAAQYNQTEGAGAGGADPATGAQGGGAGAGSFMGQQVGGGSGGGGSVQVNTSGGGASGVGYVPDSDLHPVFLGESQLNTLGWDGVSTHGVKILSILGWDEAEDAQVAVDNRAGQDGEIPRELLMGGSSMTIKGIVSGADREELYANRRVLKGMLQPQPEEQILKMPDGATPGPFATTYGAALAGYLRKSCRVVQSVTWGDAVGPYAHTFEVVLRASDPRRLDDEVVSGNTGSISSGGGVTAPVTAPVGFSSATGGTVTVQNPGDYEAPFTIDVHANGSAITNPIVEDLAGTFRIVFDGLVLGSSDWLEIDMQARTALLNGTSSRFQYIDFEQTTWGLLPEGTSTIQLRGSVISDPSYAEVQFRPAYL